MGGDLHEMKDIRPPPHVTAKSRKRNKLFKTQWDVSPVRSVRRVSPFGVTSSPGEMPKLDKANMTKEKEKKYNAKKNQKVTQKGGGGGNVFVLI
jgi:hypothetical protein